MVSEILQLIKDEIICHKKAIEDIEDKLNFLSFLKGFDDSMGRSLNLNEDELMSRRKELEHKLKELINKKSALSGGQESIEELNTSTGIQSSFLMSNYLSLNNYENTEKDAGSNSNSGQ